MEQIYSNSIEFGKFYVWFMFLIAIVVAIVLLWFAWSVKSFNNQYAQSTKAIVRDSACESISKDVNECNLDVSYTVADTEYSLDNMRVISATPIQSGDKVSIRYNYSDPTKVIPASDLVSPLWSNILTCSALLIVLIAGFRLYLAQNFRFAAAGSGVAGLISVFRS